MRFDPSSDNIIDVSFQFDYRLSALVVLGSLILQVLYLNIASKLMYRDPNIVMIYPHFDQSTLSPEFNHYLEELDIDKLNELIFDMAKRFDIDLDEIYLTYTPIPNAYTLKIMFSNSILNINSNIFEILNQNEVEAVILHELGHLKHNDSILKLIYSSPSTFIHLSFAYIYFTIIITIFYSLIFDFNIIQTGVRIGILFVIYFGFQLYNSIVSSYLIKAERASELLADLFAAENLGSIPTINALIRLGQRIENIQILLSQFQKMEFMQRMTLTPEDNDRLIRLLKHFPSQEMDDILARLYAPYIYLYSEISRLKDIYKIPLDEPSITNLAEQGVKNLYNAGLLEFEVADPATRSKLSRNWRDFDFDKNEYLDGSELKVYLQTLLNEPDKYLFSNEISINRFQREHPDFRRRILNIWDNYPL